MDKPIWLEELETNRLYIAHNPNNDTWVMGIIANDNNIREILTGDVIATDQLIKLDSIKGYEWLEDRIIGTFLDDLEKNHKEIYELIEKI